jgi:hypothetical protein
METNEKRNEAAHYYPQCSITATNPEENVAE